MRWCMDTNTVMLHKNMNNNKRRNIFWPSGIVEVVLIDSEEIDEDFIVW